MTCLFLSARSFIINSRLTGTGGIRIEVKLTILPEHTTPVAEIKTDQVTPQVERIMKWIEQDGEGVVLSLPTKKGVERADTSTIALIRTEVGKVIVYKEDGEWHEVKSTLTELEALVGEGFARISKSAIVNIASVKSVRASFSGTLDLLLKNGMEDVISRNYRKSFKSKLGV